MVGRAARERNPGDHEAELIELQRRFNALSEQKRTAEGALLTKEVGQAPDDVRYARGNQLDLSLSTEIPKLDEQIVELRRKHDRLHDSNHKKRQDLNHFVDKLNDLHSSRYQASETPQARLQKNEAALADSASRCSTA